MTILFIAIPYILNALGLVAVSIVAFYSWLFGHSAIWLWNLNSEKLFVWFMVSIIWTLVVVGVMVTADLSDYADNEGDTR